MSRMKSQELRRLRFLSAFRIGWRVCVRESDRTVFRDLRCAAGVPRDEAKNTRTALPRQARFAARIRVAGFTPRHGGGRLQSANCRFATLLIGGLASWWDRGGVQPPPRPTTGADEERRARSSPQKCYLVCKSVRIGLVVCKTFTRVAMRGLRVAGFKPLHTHFFAPSFPPHQHFLAPSFPPN